MIAEPKNANRVRRTEILSMWVKLGDPNGRTRVVEIFSECTEQSKKPVAILYDDGMVALFAQMYRQIYGDVKKADELEKMWLELGKESGQANTYILIYNSREAEPVVESVDGLVAPRKSPDAEAGCEPDKKNGH